MVCLLHTFVKKLPSEYQMLTKTYLHSNLCDSPVGSDSRDRSDRSDSSGSSNSSNSSDSGGQI